MHGDRRGRSNPLSIEALGVPAQPPYVRKPTLYDGGFSESIELPYGLTVAVIRGALQGVYGFIHEVNSVLVKKSYARLEETILGNSLSGFVSELFVKNIGAKSETLARNAKIGGHPDLIPRTMYPDDEVLHASEGIEVKTSIQSGGWQGHNPEECWVMVVQYAVDVINEPVESRRPIEILKVMVALLEQRDWSFSGRKGRSRRTPTASILKTGTAKLHDNAVYEHPGYVRNLNRMAERLDEIHRSR